MHQLASHLVLRFAKQLDVLIAAPECCCRGLHSAAMSRVDDIRADEAQQYQNRQNREKQKRDHSSLSCAPL